MKRSVLVLGVLAVSVGIAGAAERRCFEVSTKEGSFSRTPEKVCLDSKDNHDYTVELRTGMMDGEEVGRFHLQLVKRVRCADCNQDELALENPANSAFNELRLKFDGKRNLSTGEETGTLWIGANKFYYRAMPATTPVPPPKTPGHGHGPVVPPPHTK